MSIASLQAFVSHYLTTAKLKVLL